jgi:PTS system mannose-specific IIC component
LSRFAVNIGFLDRPITLGLIFGLVSGDIETALGISVFFELLWLDFFPAGTYIPPNRALATCLCLALSHMLGLTLPGHVLLLLLLALPAALIGAKLEAWQRVWQNTSYNMSLYWVKNDVQSFGPGALIRRGLLQLFLLQTGAFFLIGLACLLIVQEVMVYWPLTLTGLHWGHLWAAALIGGILSLRIKAAYGVFLIGMAVALLVLWFTSLA